MKSAARDPQLTVDLGHPRDASILGTSKEDNGRPAQRLRSPRYTLLIRAAKLVTDHGEFICVVRDVSETGVRLRLFHDPPTGEPIELHMVGGDVYSLRQVRQDGNEVGCEFIERIDLPRFLTEENAYPKRGLRLSLCFPINIVSLSGLRDDGTIVNLSQQGARFSCKGMYAIDQALRVECTEQEVGFGAVSAKVRWRRDSEYGVVFENTLSLEEFAKLAAKLQKPELLSANP
ncbi:PilZ domain-containing protein [uncultured Erythrobacter sp.]|uniref:PilZ domain-containing protein n=1 Tax=uncultured Erythrobacter sp. TaxID=263913 RepID=UPI0026135809|nr:PilZ domain-containing protein [uncultured Erythrobacter sp.]